MSARSGSPVVIISSLADRQVGGRVEAEAGRPRRTRRRARRGWRPGPVLRPRSPPKPAAPRRPRARPRPRIATPAHDDHGTRRPFLGACGGAEVLDRGHAGQHGDVEQHGSQVSAHDGVHHAGRGEGRDEDTRAVRQAQSAQAQLDAGAARGDRHRAACADGAGRTRARRPRPRGRWSSSPRPGSGRGLPVGRSRHSPRRPRRAAGPAPAAAAGWAPGGIEPGNLITQHPLPPCIVR